MSGRPSCAAVRRFLPTAAQAPATARSLRTIVIRPGGFATASWKTADLSLQSVSTR